MLRRTIAAVFWAFFAFGSLLSFSLNPDRKWYDYASAAPILVVLLALLSGYDRFLIEELDGWLAKIRPKKGAGKQGNDSHQ